MKRLLSCALAGVTLARQNPIRKIVTLLQNMEQQVEKDGRKEEKLMEKYQCYCKATDADLSGAIAEAETKISELESAVKEGASQKDQLTSELEQHKEDRASCNTALAESESLREKEARANEACAADLSRNLEGLSKAIPAIEKGMAGPALLQTDAGSALRSLLSSSARMSVADRAVLSEFLQSGSRAAGSGEILGMLKQMQEEMQGDLADIQKQEAEAVSAFNDLVAAKKEERAAATKAISEKTGRAGDVAVELAEDKHALSDTTESLGEDSKFLANLRQSCTAKSKAWEVRQKTRGEEIEAIHETIKILNDDESLDLFNKALPAADGPAAVTSLLQVRMSSRWLAKRALNLVQSAAAASSQPQPQLQLIAMALRSKKVSFEGVLKMIDNMDRLLRSEGADDRKHLEYCRAELSKAGNKQTSNKRDIKDVTAARGELKECVAATGEEIKVLEAGIKALDRSVAEASAQRKAENAEFTEVSANNNAATQLIAIAKNRLRKFYQPHLYKEEAPRELSEEDRVFQASDGELAPTPAPSGIASTGVSLAFVQVGPPRSPTGVYGKNQGSGGVMAMLDMLVADLAKEAAEAKVEEKNSQDEYERLMGDSKAKREADGKAIVSKSMSKAQAEEELQGKTSDLKTAKTALLEINEYISSLRVDCDFIMQNFGLRKQARDSELEGLKQAKAVLAGADFS